MQPELKAACRSGDVEEFKRIVDMDLAQLKTVDQETLDTTLHEASEFGHDDLAKEILNMKPEMVKALNLRKETPLHKAAAEGFLPVVEVLLDANPSLANRLDSEKRSAFFVACEGGHLEVVEELKKRSNISTVEKLDCRGQSGLFVASQNGHDRVVEYLLNHTRLLRLEGEGRRHTSLHVAALKGHGKVVREIMKACEAMAWTNDPSGYLPIHLASREGQIHATKELLTKDASLCFGLTVKEKLTPIHIAAIEGHAGVMAEILKTCIESAEETTKQKETFLHLCVKNHQYQAIKYVLGRFPLVDTLVNKGDCNGNTILHLASINNMSPEMVRYLAMQTFVDINAKNKNGHTALDLASNTTISEILEKTGAKKSQSKSMMEKSQGKKLTQDYIDAEKQLAHTAKSTHSHGDLALLVESEENSCETKPEDDQSHNVGSSRRSKSEVDLSPSEEHLQSSRNTLVTISSGVIGVTFFCWINAPRYLPPEDPQNGQAILASIILSSAYKMFNMCAMFLAFGIAITLLITLNIKAAKIGWLLSICQKLMIVALVCLILVFSTGIGIH